MLILRHLSLSFLLIAMSGAAASAQVMSEALRTSAGNMQVSAVVTGLDTP